MGTAKRERQKANRAKREQEIARAKTKSRTTRIAAIVIGAVVGIFGLVFIVGQFVGDDDETPTPTPDTSVIVTTPSTDDAAFLDTVPLDAPPPPTAES